MTLSRRIARAMLAALVLSAATASAQMSPASDPSASVSPSAPKPAAQGVAVLGMGASREEAFGVARAIYGSTLRPRRLDELRARILAGDPAPPTASRELKDLAELRAGVKGEDAASRQLLSTIAQRLDVKALLVVSVAPSAPAKPEVMADAGAETAPAATTEADAGAQLPPAVTARLFLSDSGDFDAARYEPDAPSGGWRGTVSSLVARFPAPARAPTAQLQGPPPKLSPGKEDKPFYMSPWLWGALGAAAVVGGFFFFTTQDTSNDPIHLQMRVPR